MQLAQRRPPRFCGSRTRARRRTSPRSTSPIRARPRSIVQTDLPHAQMRSNSLEVAGDLMAVAYQVTKFGLKPAGFELFDISVPEQPRSISFFDASGPHSRGCHQLWFVDGKTVHMACADPELKPRNPKDDQIYRIVDVANPSKPRRGRPLAPARHHGRRRRAAAAAPAGEVRRRLPRAQHQRLSASAPTAATSATSTAASWCSTSRDRARPKLRVALDQFAALQRLQPHRAAVLRAAACSW